MVFTIPVGYTSIFSFFEKYTLVMPASTPTNSHQVVCRRLSIKVCQKSDMVTKQRKRILPNVGAFGNANGADFKKTCTTIVILLSILLAHKHLLRCLLYFAAAFLESIFQKTIIQNTKTSQLWYVPHQPFGTVPARKAMAL